MPYDPHPMSVQERAAPAGMYRVIGVDTFDGEDWVYPEGDYKSLDKAIARAKKETKGEKQMLKVYIYDDQGRFVHEEGKF